MNIEELEKLINPIPEEPLGLTLNNLNAGDKFKFIDPRLYNTYNYFIVVRHDMTKNITYVLTETKNINEVESYANVCRI